MGHHPLCELFHVVLAQYRFRLRRRDQREAGRGPTTAEQKEVGVKYEIPGTNAIVTAAYFDIDQKDGIVLDDLDGVNKRSASSTSTPAVSRWRPTRRSTTAGRFIGSYTNIRWRSKGA